MSDEKTFDELLGVSAASEGEAGVAEVLVALQDGEAHTIGTIDQTLQEVGLDLSGCKIAACLVYLRDVEGYAIKPLGPFDIFGSPARFKLEAPSS